MAKANGVTFEGAVPAEHEVYFALTVSTHFRAPTVTLTHCGGMEIEELDKQYVAQAPFDELTGMKAFVVANALADIGAPPEIISPLVQQLLKLWELYHNFGMTALELNPIRMRPDRSAHLWRRRQFAGDRDAWRRRDHLLRFRRQPALRKDEIVGKSNNTDIYETFRAMADALHEHVSAHGPTPLYAVIGRGGPNLVRGMGGPIPARRSVCPSVSLASIQR